MKLTTSLLGGAFLLCTPAFMMLLAQDPASNTTPASQPGGPPAGQKKGKRPPRPGVSTPGVKREMSTITPVAVFETGGTPDWQVVTEEAVWVANGPKDMIHRLGVSSNKVEADIPVGKRPCSGLAAGFGSIWVPNCGDKSLSRVDIQTNKVTATVPLGPAESEGGIATSPDAVWMLTDKAGKLSRIDPKTNTAVAAIDVPAGSVSALYGDGAIWLTNPEKNLLTRVDARTNEVTDKIDVGPGPRFQTFGAGSIWTLNQGDGTVTRVDTKSRKVTAKIQVGVPSSGGELAFGLGHVWATVFQIPISEIDPATNAVIRQWVGDGGDSIRAAHGSVWLSNLRAHNVWRIDPAKF